MPLNNFIAFSWERKYLKTRFAIEHNVIKGIMHKESVPKNIAIKLVSHFSVFRFSVLLHIIFIFTLTLNSGYCQSKGIHVFVALCDNEHQGIVRVPEAYTLKAAIDGWILNETGGEIDERAAQMYHQYQKSGIKGARNLFTRGF